MLDHRIETFLILCRTGSFTNTAEKCHITQPAVSQQIKSLESDYGGPLFLRKGKRPVLTDKGQRLLHFANTLQADAKKAIERIKAEGAKPRLDFGATLTIGEFFLPPILNDYLGQFPEAEIKMLVDNTKVLLSSLDEGKIDFALIEGNFDKYSYTHHLLSQEDFIAVCGPDHPFAGKDLDFADLFSTRLILREEGSGSRDILETVLHERNTDFHHFHAVTEIGNINAIKTLTASGKGITFIYREAVKKELMEKTLLPLKIRGFQCLREFNFIHLENSFFQDEYRHFFEFCRGRRKSKQ